MALPMVMITMVLVGVVAMAVHQQVTADRYAFEMVQSHRLATLAAASAFEEAAARIEGLNAILQMQPLAEPEVGFGDPGPAANVPSEILIPATEKAFEPLGLSLGRVRMEATDWVRHGARTDRTRGEDRMLTQDLGILHLSVDVLIKVGWTTARHSVTSRRYIVAAADTLDGRMSVQVQPLDMAMQVEGTGE